MRIALEQAITRQLYIVVVLSRSTYFLQPVAETLLLLKLGTDQFTVVIYNCTVIFLYVSNRYIPILGKLLHGLLVYDMILSCERPGMTLKAPTG